MRLSSGRCGRLPPSTRDSREDSHFYSPRLSPISTPISLTLSLTTMRFVSQNMIPSSAISWSSGCGHKDRGSRLLKVFQSLLACYQPPPTAPSQSIAWCVPQHASFASTPPKRDDLKRACRAVAQLSNAELVLSSPYELRTNGQRRARRGKPDGSRGRKLAERDRLRLGHAIPIDARKDSDRFRAWLTRRGGVHLSVPLLRQAA